MLPNYDQLNKPALITDIDHVNMRGDINFGVSSGTSATDYWGARMSVDPKGRFENRSSFYC